MLCSHFYRNTAAEYKRNSYTACYTRVLEDLNRTSILLLVFYCLSGLKTILKVETETSLPSNLSRNLPYYCSPWKRKYLSVKKYLSVSSLHLSISLY